MTHRHTPPVSDTPENPTNAQLRYPCTTRGAHFTPFTQSYPSFGYKRLGIRVGVIFSDKRGKSVSFPPPGGQG